MTTDDRKLVESQPGFWSAAGLSLIVTGLACFLWFRVTFVDTSLFFGIAAILAAAISVGAYIGSRGIARLAPGSSSVLSAPQRLWWQLGWS